MAVGQCNIPHVNQLVQSALQKKHGINEIIQLIGRAAIGTYKPRHTDQEHLMSVVLYQLGGAHCRVRPCSSQHAWPIHNLTALHDIDPCHSNIPNY